MTTYTCIYTPVRRNLDSSRKVVELWTLCRHGNRRVGDTGRCVRASSMLRLRENMHTVLVGRKVRGNGLVLRRCVRRAPQVVNV